MDSMNHATLRAWVRGLSWATVQFDSAPNVFKEHEAGQSIKKV